MRKKIKTKKPSVKRVKKKHNRKHIHLVFAIPSVGTLILFSFGFLCVIFFLGYKIHKQNYLAFRTSPTVQHTENNFRNDPIPAEIKIRSVGIVLPVKETQIVDDIWTINENGASHLAISALPGMSGNVVIYGHNTKQVFGSLPNVKKGDVIELTLNNGEVFQYKVKETFVVNPEQIEVLQPTKVETLTLYTCTGFFDSKRFIVKAEPL